MVKKDRKVPSEMNGLGGDKLVVPTTQRCCWAVPQPQSFLLFSLLLLQLSRMLGVATISPLLPLSQHAPGVPRILVGNRLHLAFKRQVPTEQARAYAEKNCMTFFEVSPLCDFNVIESFTELSRIVLMRHGMEKIWRPNRGQWAHTEPWGCACPGGWELCNCGSCSHLMGRNAWGQTG